jgi:polysaccharide pyruvyl transferase WcaK-like protein
VVVCPLFAAGSLWGEDDSTAFTALAALIRRLRREGREVVAMSAFPEDDRWLLTLMRDAGAPDLPYLAGYADLDDTLRCLASADLVVGERLHASVLAAACGVPFVAVEYRPKVRDFARSVGMEQAVVRSDEMHRLDEVVTWALGERDTVASALGAAVEAIRNHQREVVTELHRLLTDE